MEFIQSFRESDMKTRIDNAYCTECCVNERCGSWSDVQQCFKYDAGEFIGKDQVEVKSFHLSCTSGTVYENRNYIGIIIWHKNFQDSFYINGKNIRSGYVILTELTSTVSPTIDGILWVSFIRLKILKFSNGCTLIATPMTNRCGFLSLVFYSGQKMAQRALYVIKCPQQIKQF